LVSTLNLNRRKRGPLVIAALVVAMAIVVALVVLYRPASPAAPKAASPDGALVPYKNMVESGLSAVTAAQSQHCDTIADTGCPAAAARLMAPLTSWLDDLNRASTPPVFAYVDLQLRRHVALIIADLDAMVNAGARYVQVEFTDSSTVVLS